LLLLNKISFIHSFMIMQLQNRGPSTMI